MKDKHIRIRIEQCLALAEASNCPRRKFGALLLDPARNVILMDGYNGGPRGGGELCGGEACLRDTMKIESKIQLDGSVPFIQVWKNGEEVDLDEFENLQVFGAGLGGLEALKGLKHMNFEIESLEALKGLEGLKALYPSFCDGSVDPAAGHMITMAG